MSTLSWLIILLIIVVLERKTSRPDGVFKHVHPYRRIMWFIMPTRNESVVYFDEYVLAEDLLAYLDEARERFGANITHAIVGAVAIGLHENPTMNRFVAGRRLYQRKGRWISFSMKRKKMDKKARLAVVKQLVPDSMTFRHLCEEVNAHINVQRSGKKTYSDKEIGFFNGLPRLVFVVLFPLVRLADYYNLLPKGFIDGDPMYTSAFLANLGSVKMGAGYHHLYEWGTCPLFLMAGQIEERPVIVDGAVVPRKVLHIRFSYDERIDDGLSARFGIETVKRVLENPYAELGCLQEDGSDTVRLVGKP